MTLRPSEENTERTKDRSIESTSSEVDPYVFKVGKSLRTIPPGELGIITVNYGFNHIKSLPSYIFFMRGYRDLMKIELHNNQITNVSRNAFKNLRQLRILDLSENNITSLETSTFKSNVMLEKLDLTSNRISFDPLRPFLSSMSLETLILTDNDIEEVFEMTFYKLPKLRYLFMDKNCVFFIEVESFSSMKHLNILSLAHTNVHKLSITMFRNNQTLPSAIDVTDTPLANRFDPPLKKVKHDGVWKLVNIDSLF